ncbi:MAG: tRNA pseudouridine(38-40) synthase TruA [Candidatus Saccharibacteria bacterium]
MRIKLTIEYDGTDFNGFQRQPELRTVDQALEKAIIKVTGEPTRVTGAGRTDAGVHALGQVVAFDTESSVPPERFALALNSYLPEDLQVIKSEEAADDFHPRRSAVNKTYRYRVYREREAYTFWRRYAHLYAGDLNIEDMQAAAAMVVGEHDFRSFMASGSTVEDTVRTIFDFTVVEEKPWLTFEVTGNGFLYNMVRNLVGTLLEVGRGAMTVSQFREVVESRNRTLAGPTAPANGLFLVEVRY